MAGSGSTLFSGGLFWRRLRFSGNWCHIILRWIILEATQIWRELVPHYFPANCFGGGSDLAGNGSTLFSGGLFWRQFKFGKNWLLVIFWQIVLEAAQIWREMAPHYFPADCFGCGSDLAGTGSTLFYRWIDLEAAQIWRELAPHYFTSGLFWWLLRFGGKRLHIIFRRIVLEVAQIWRKLAPHYFPADCFGGSSDLAGTGSKLFSSGI